MPVGDIMMLVLSLLDGAGPYTWFIVGALFLTAEVVLPGINLIWFGLAASGTGALTLAWPRLFDAPLGWEGQMLSFIAIALVAVGIARIVFARREEDGTDKVNRSVDAHVGRELVLAEPIEGGLGRARFGDSLWRVSGPDMPMGARVRVVAADGVTLRVERVDVADGAMVGGRSEPSTLGAAPRS